MQFACSCDLGQLDVPYTAVGSMSLKTCQHQQLFPHLEIQPTNAKMVGYFWSTNQSAGKVKVNIEYNPHAPP
jgi:hypothetical protein